MSIRVVDSAPSAAFCGLLLLATAGCAVPVAVSLDDAETAHTIEWLERAGIAGRSRPDVEGSGQTVVVAQTEAERALRILRTRPPRPATPTLEEAFADPGWVPSRLAERARLAVGIAGDLERTLRRMDGVSAARVHVALPETSPLTSQDTARTPTASVLLIHDAPAPPFFHTDVQRIVAGAVAGLSPEAVTVITRPNERALPPPVALARLGPLTVTRDGLSTARVLALVVVLSNALLLAALLVTWRRAHRRAPSSTGAP
jgi:type III secretion system YscJ/HrcJ family lipoprotein